MPTLAITLPDELAQYVEARVAAGDAAGPDEFVAGLVRAHQEQRVEANIDAMLLRELDAGEHLTEPHAHPHSHPHHGGSAPPAGPGTP